MRMVDTKEKFPEVGITGHEEIEKQSEKLAQRYDRRKKIERTMTIMEEQFDKMQQSSSDIVGLVGAEMNLMLSLVKLIREEFKDA